MCHVCVFVMLLLLLLLLASKHQSNSLFNLFLWREDKLDYLPWLDLIGLNVMAGATVLGVPVKQMLTTENVAGEAEVK